MATFELPANGHKEKVTWLSGLAYVFFGPLYFLFRGMFSQFLGWFLLTIITVGIAWPVGWFMAGGVVKKHLLRSGYRQLS